MAALILPSISTKNGAVYDSTVSYLNRPDIAVAEVAYLLGYEDSNSFYRAFRTWEGTTPSQLRAELKRPVN